MREMTIIADDLTGAVDAAAAFASPHAPVEISWRGIPDALRVAVDTESRDLPAADAERIVSASLAEAAGSRRVFKKIDSLLRGNTMVELAACCRSADFEMVLIAPAFPAQSRMTRTGRLYSPDELGKLQPGVSIVTALADHGIAAEPVAPGNRLPRRGAAICDIETVADLRAMVAEASDLDVRILWCGSAGLARALAGEISLRPDVPRPSIVVIGSRHPASREHARRIEAAIGTRCVSLTEAASLNAAIDMIAGHLAARRSVALAFDLAPLPPQQAEAIYRAAFAKLSASAQAPNAIAIVGGDTLYRLVTALDATSLAAIGEWAPGIPISRINGGPWHGTAIYSKSGAFNDAGLFDAFIQGDSQRA